MPSQARLVRSPLVLFILATAVAATAFWATRERGRDETSPRSVWAGVYTPAQARAGADVYHTECESCHGNDLGGNDEANALVGLPFTYRWRGLSVADLFNIIRATMPPDTPGSLTPDRYVDVVAYLLEANAYPPGNAPLPPDEARLLLIAIHDEPDN